MHRHTGVHGSGCKPLGLAPKPLLALCGLAALEQRPLAQLQVRQHLKGTAERHACGTIILLPEKIGKLSFTGLRHSPELSGTIRKKPGLCGTIIYSFTF